MERDRRTDREREREGEIKRETGDRERQRDRETEREREGLNICGWAIKPGGLDRPPCPRERESERV